MFILSAPFYNHYLFHIFYSFVAYSSLIYFTGFLHLPLYPCAYIMSILYAYSTFFLNTLYQTSTLNLWGILNLILNIQNFNVKIVGYHINTKHRSILLQRDPKGLLLFGETGSPVPYQNFYNKCVSYMLGNMVNFFSKLEVIKLQQNWERVAVSSGPTNTFVNHFSYRSRNMIDHRKLTLRELLFCKKLCLLQPENFLPFTYAQFTFTDIIMCLTNSLLSQKLLLSKRNGIT